ncbi:MAG: class I SAM-dependent methyltransferase [Alphaproteobacteria bacterium]
MSALYDRLGKGYAAYRRPDPRIAAMIRAALGDAKSAVNFGAGAGSYEIAGLHVAAIEPSAEMIAQRPAWLAKAVQAFAEDAPFADKSFDAATAFLTTHHWRDQEKGLNEMKRVARKRCVFFDGDLRGLLDFWLLRDYFPDMLSQPAPVLSTDVLHHVFGEARVAPVLVPWDCTDGFLCAYWRSPERYLDPGARNAISFFHNALDVEARIERLRRDINDGTWARRNAHLLSETEHDYGYRLIIAELRD